MSFNASEPAGFGAPPTAGAELCNSSGDARSARRHGAARADAAAAAPRAAPRGAPDDGAITAACCDVAVAATFGAGALHSEGRLVAAGYQQGYKLRDPGVAGLLAGCAGAGECDAELYDPGACSPSSLQGLDAQMGRAGQPAMRGRY